MPSGMSTYRVDQPIFGLTSSLIHDEMSWTPWTTIAASKLQKQTNADLVRRTTVLEARLAPAIFCWYLPIPISIILRHWRQILKVVSDSFFLQDNRNELAAGRRLKAIQHGKSQRPLESRAYLHARFAWMHAHQIYHPLVLHTLWQETTRR